MDPTNDPTLRSFVPVSPPSAFLPGQDVEFRIEVENMRDLSIEGLDFVTDDFSIGESCTEFPFTGAGTWLDSTATDWSTDPVTNPPTNPITEMALGDKATCLFTITIPPGLTAAGKVTLSTPDVASCAVAVTVKLPVKGP